MERHEPKSVPRRALIDPDSQLPAHDDFADEPVEYAPPKNKPQELFDDSSQLDERETKKNSALNKRFSLMSGAELASRQADSGPRYPPHLFKHGMHVLHPEHGLGEIVALGGEGPKRTATVRFQNDSRERRFFLLHAKLEPVDEPS
jgi:DNA helicase II / ATP-dependent DNA helicase PcrA